MTEEIPEHQLPALPDNFERDPDESEFITICRRRTHYGNEANWTTEWDEIDWRRYIDAYYQLVERVDGEVGRVLDALREAGLEDDTLVVLTSDHGEGMAAHKWVVKLMLYDEAAAVPFIMRYPGGVPSGQVDAQHLVSGIDLVPTVCDYAGVACPDTVTGVSLRSAVEQDDPGRDYLVCQLSPDTKRLEMKGRMMRTDRFKYLVFSEGNNPEMFFDMADDPGEKVNLIAHSDFQGEVARHRVLLQNWIQITDDPFVL